MIWKKTLFSLLMIKFFHLYYYFSLQKSRLFSKKFYINRRYRPINLRLVDFWPSIEKDLGWINPWLWWNVEIACENFLLDKKNSCVKSWELIPIKWEWQCIQILTADWSFFLAILPLLTSFGRKSWPISPWGRSIHSHLRPYTGQAKLLWIKAQRMSILTFGTDLF